MAGLRTRPHIGAIAVGVLFLLAGLAMLVGAAGAFLQDTRIARAGTTLTAVVLGKEMVFSSLGDSDFEISYAFTLPDGSRRQSTSLISRQRWLTLQEGDTLEIRIDAFDPTRSFPVGEGVTSPFMLAFMALFGLAMAVPGGMLLLGGLRAGKSTS